MTSFIQRWAGLVLGTLSGWDRLRFRGTLRWLAHARALFGFLWHHQVLLKDFGAYADSISTQLRTAVEARAQQQGRPVRYRASAQQRQQPTR